MALGAGAIFLANYEWCFEGLDGLPRWITKDFKSLGPALDQKVFGQHLVVEVVYNSIKGHIQNHDPEKALVLSFHGSTGCGKNHVSRIIADNMYKRGMKSKYVNQIIAPIDFPHNDWVDYYKQILHRRIVDKVKLCPKTLFIFDEVDKMPVGLLDALRPFLEHHRHVNGVDYRKCIFIFLSNTGATRINEFVLEHWKAGNKREDITIKDMDQIINKDVFNVKDSGFYHSQLIKSNLIDFFVPFLPLEKSHVEQCINADLIQKGKDISREIVKKIADEMQYSNNLFSQSGCKRVSTRVDYMT